MARFKIVGVVALALSLSACINSSTLVKVKTDGSGTVEQTMLVNLQAMKGLMAGMGAGSGQMKESGGLPNEAEMKRTAERMGARLVSVTPLKENGFEGSKALYAFDDITKIRVDQDPMTGTAAGQMAKSSGKNNPIRFTLTKQGGSSVLSIAVDEKTASAATDKAAAKAPNMDAIDPAMMQMVKTMFQGFKVLIDLEVDGKIVKTNADYVNGSRITLFELDMASLLEDEAKLRALQGKIGPGASITDVKPYLKDVKGVKINHPSLTVEYR
jgi:hypothetical protein